MEMYTLANDNKMPALGFGMWQNSDPVEAAGSVKAAIKVGFRHIDGAGAYENEEWVGEGIRQSGIDRKELFLTSKLRNVAHGYDNVRREVHDTLAKLQTDYLDLYLIHWPVVQGHGADWERDNLETWQAFEELYDEGVLKAIGVSNFSVEHLENLVRHARIKPMVDQLLVHPGVLQEETRTYCAEHGIVVEAYSPLKPLKVLKEDARVQAMVEKYGKSLAQILLRFDLQIGVVPLTKSVHRERIRENFAIFDFTLNEEDMRFLKSWRHPDFTEPDNRNERPPQIK